MEKGILDSLSEGIIAFNRSGKITFANQVACQMLCVVYETMLGNLLQETLSPYTDLAEKGQALVNQVLKTSAPDKSAWHNDKLYLNLIAMPQVNQNGVILVLQDKTADYKLLEVGKDFIANASHELRTPITIIRGFAEMLQDGVKLNAALRKEIAEKITRTCIRLEKLVKGLLRMADLENVTDVYFQPKDLSLLLELCKKSLVTAYPEVIVTIHCKEPHLIVSLDADLFEMAVMNLLENAVKYSPPHAQIEMRLQCDGTNVSLDIEDRGIGIPERDLSHVFERFYTVDKARSRKSGGAGLGLSIVKTIIQKHGGSISVASELNKGSVFTIVLPFRR